jgi:tRNA 2-thiouridine synthesizing protein A
MAHVPPILRLAQARAGGQCRGMAESLIDAQFQKNPLPVLRAARRLRSMVAGEKLRVLVSAAEVVGDLRDYCRTSGHALIASSETRGVFSITIRCQAAPSA